MTFRRKFIMKGILMICLRLLRIQLHSDGSLYIQIATSSQQCIDFRYWYAYSISIPNTYINLNVASLWAAGTEIYFPFMRNHRNLINYNGQNDKLNYDSFIKNYNSYKRARTDHFDVESVRQQLIQYYLAIISDQFSMSLINAFALKDPLLPESHSPLPKDQLKRPLVGENLSDIKDNKKRSIFFNGIIFRDQDLLQHLGVYESITRQQNIKAFIQNKSKNSFISIGIKLMIAKSFDKIIKILLAQYNEEASLEVKFAFIQRHYTYCNYDFVKVNFIAQASSHNIKLLLCNSSFDALVKILNHKSIRFYIAPQINDQCNYLSQNYSLQQICSLDQSLSACQFEEEKIEYTASCTFNGRQTCFAIFTTCRVIILHENSLLKCISKDEFKQYQYWIENQQDWISFQSKDHLLVFKERVQVVAVKAAEIESRRSAIKSSMIEEEIKAQQVCNKIQENHAANIQFLTYTSIKTSNNFEEERRCFSYQPEYRHTFDEDADKCKLSKRLFEDDRMVDQSSDIKQELKEQNRQFQINSSNGSSSIIGEEIQSKMIDQSELNEQKVGNAQQTFKQTKNQIINSLFQQFSQCPYQQQIIKNENRIPFIEQKKLEIEQITVRTTFEQNLNCRQADLKQNCQNFLNRVCEVTKTEQIKWTEPQVSQDSYIFSRKESLLRLQHYNSDQAFIESHHHQLIDTLSIPYEENKMEELRFADVRQISSNLLAALTVDQKLLFYKKSSSGEYEIKETNMSNSLIPSKLYTSNIHNSLLFSEYNSNNLFLYHLSHMIQEQIRLPYIKGELIKDALASTENELIVLTNNSIGVIDKRESQHHKEMCFKTSQLFEKLAVKSSIAAVGRSDGKVKLFDLRILKPKSLNNFDLISNKNKKMQSNLSRHFKNLKILSNQNIFCQYESSSFIINAQNRAGKSIYSSNLKQSQRSFIIEHSIHPKILKSIDDYHNEDFDDSINFSIDDKGESVVALYKNFKFQFQAASQKLQAWNKIENAFNRRYFYLNFNEFRAENELVSGYYSKDGSFFRVESR